VWHGPVQNPCTPWFPVLSEIVTVSTLLNHYFVDSVSLLPTELLNDRDEQAERAYGSRIGVSNGLDNGRWSSDIPTIGRLASP